MLKLSAQQKAIIEIDRCDRKIIEMLGRRLRAVDALNTATSFAAKKIYATDLHADKIHRLNDVAEAYETPMSLAKPTFDAMLRAFEHYESYKEWSR